MTGPPPNSPLFPNTTLSRSDHARIAPRRFEQPRHERGRGGFAMRAGDDDRMFAADEELIDRLRHRRVREVHLQRRDRKSTRLNSSHSQISYAVFCLKKKITL